jgi:DNA primase
MDYVQVRKSDLIEYVNEVNALIQDHDKQTQELSDIRSLADIVNETWQTRLDRLADYILDLDPKSKSDFEQGLMMAYEVMKGQHE